MSLTCLVVVLAGGLSAACRSASGGQGAPVKLGYFANLSHAQAVLGVASGDFARAVSPEALETKVFNAGPSLIEALFAGEIDVGYVGPGPVISAYNNSDGKGIRVLAGAAADGVVIVARKGSGITSLADLGGARLATPQLGNTQDLSARHYVSAVLKEQGASNVIPVDSAQQAALFARGDLDAAWVPEPWGERLIVETGATLVAQEKDLWPSKQFALTLVVTTPEFLASRPDVVERLLRAHRVWTQRLVEHPDQYVGALGDALFGITGQRLGAGILPAAIKRVQFIDEPLDDTLRTFAQWNRDLGFARRQPPIEGLVDTTILHTLSAVAQRGPE